MIDRLLQATVFVWMALAVVWVVGALRTKRTVQSQSSASQLLYTAILAAGVFLIFAKQVQSFGEQYLQYRHRVKALAPFIF